MNIKEKLALANPIYWPAWMGMGLLWLTTLLPNRGRIALGKHIGRFIYWLPTQLKHITDVNLKLCFPELSLDERKALAIKNFESLGIGLMEAAMAWWMPDKKLQQLFNVTGYEHVEQAFKRGKGVILLGPHFTSLEMVGRLLGMRYTFAVMYRPHKKAFIDFIQKRFRQKHYALSIPRHDMRQLIRALNDNIAIWYAYDVDGGRKRSVFAPFFGIKTASLTSVSRIVRMSDAAIVPISFYRKDDAFQYEIVLGAPIENAPTGDFEKDAEIFNASLEEAIRKKPEQYVWQYKRFKTRPPGEARLY